MTRLKWKLNSVCLERVLILTQDRCTVSAEMYHRLRNRFGHTKWCYKVMRLKWKLNSVCLEIVLILTQVRCTVCAKHTIGPEIVLDAPNGTPR